MKWWLYNNDPWLRPLRWLIVVSVLGAGAWRVAGAAEALYGRIAGATKPAASTAPSARVHQPARREVEIREPEHRALAFDPAARDTLPPPPLSKADRMCLARAIYHEARGEPIEGQIAVAQVVLNRVKSKRWPKTVCGVVYEGQERGEKCQFSFACYDRKDIPDSSQLWHQAKWIADDVAAGRTALEDLGHATYYHTATVKPIWRQSLSVIRQIGRHIFYADPKEPVPSELPPALMVGVARANDAAPSAPEVAVAAALSAHGGASRVLNSTAVAADPPAITAPIAARPPTPTPISQTVAKERRRLADARDAVDDPSPRRAPKAGTGSAAAAPTSQAGHVQARDPSLSGN
jgi:spore germination cell wall hydrolase CwlJ-like protein